MKLSAGVPLIDLVISWTLVTNLLLNSWLCLADDCVKIDTDPCSCKTSHYTIDLNPLIKYLDKTKPYFKDIHAEKTSDKATYSYQPCLPFSEGTACTNVAACQKLGNVTYSLGNQSSAVFGGNPANDTLYVNYTGPDNRIAHVRLRCSSAEIKQGAFTVTGESTTKLYVMEFKSSLVCVNKGLSDGSILIIVFFVLVLIYVLGGMLFLYFLRGARGVEMIPNYEFWSEFPLLVKDGVVFTMNGCKTETTYEQI